MNNTQLYDNFLELMQIAKDRISNEKNNYIDEHKNIYEEAVVKKDNFTIDYINETVTAIEKATKKNIKKINEFIDFVAVYLLNN